MTLSRPVSPLSKPTSAMADRAVAMAVAGHSRQLDKSGKPYLYHVLRVGLKCARVSDELATVGFLHDLIEDTVYQKLDLQAHFPPIIVEAVDAMSRRPGESYELYIGRVLKDDLAVSVKLADVTDNMDPDRQFPGWESLLERYNRTLFQLLKSRRAPQTFNQLAKLGVSHGDYQMSRLRSTADPTG